MVRGISHGLMPRTEVLTGDGRAEGGPSSSEILLGVMTGR